MNYLNSKKLTVREKRRFGEIFTKLKYVDFPSSLEQLEDRFWARVELDRTILEILGFSDKEINEWLQKVYDSRVRELKGI